MTVTVSAVVATRDRPDMIPGCLHSLAAALDPSDEIVVVEAGDSAVAGAVSEASLPQAVVHLRADRPGKSHQLNLGVAAAAGRLLLFTDDDVRLAPGWRDRMVACFEDPAVGAVFGRVEGLHHGARPPAGAPPDQPFEAPFATWEFAHGALMGLRAAAVREAGGFDERLGPGAPAHGEEHDLLLRMRERGAKVMIVPSAPARHLEWRDETQTRRNKLVYERGGGAFVGLALRRSLRRGAPVLTGRLGYQARLIRQDWRWGLTVLPHFAGGLLYGLARTERDWLAEGGER